MSPLGHIVERCGESCYVKYILFNKKVNMLRNEKCHILNFRFLITMYSSIYSRVL